MTKDYCLLQCDAVYFHAKYRVFKGNFSLHLQSSRR